MARAHGHSAELLFAFEEPAAAGASAARSTNIGNGTCTATPATGVNAQIGTYYLNCITAATNGGTFEVIAPDGTDLGDATVGSAFSTGSHITFTIADGSTDFAVGDGFIVTVAGYAVAPASGKYYRLPFVSVDLSGEQPLEEDDTLGLGRDPQDPTYDVLTVSGQIVVPLDLDCIGFWLKLAMGCATTGAEAPYEHVFESGARILPSATIQIGFSEVPSYFLYKGCRANSMQFGVSRQGKPQVTLQIVGQSETESNSSVDADPEDLTLTRFHKFSGKVQLASSDLSNVVSADLTYSNGLDSVQTVRADELVEAVNPGRVSLSGNITGRFADTTLIDAAAARAAVALAFVYTLTVDEEDLTLAAAASFLPKAKRGISGPGGVEASYAWQGSGSAGHALEVTLHNAISAYTNAT